MYDNIASLRFDVDINGETAAGALVSSEGEMMELRKPITAEGRVEDWMTGVLMEMRRTNRLITKEAIFYYCDNVNRYVCVWNFVSPSELQYNRICLIFPCLSQSGLDVAVPGHGGAGCQSGVVDLGGGGCL